jgi:hypothetical protein
MGNTFDFAWDSAHPAFRMKEALDYLKRHTTKPEHTRFVHRVEFYKGGGFTGEDGKTLSGCHMVVYRYAANEDGHRFICWHGLNGEEGHHAAMAKPLTFPLPAGLPYNLDFR